MLPVLLQLGPVRIYSMGVMMALALFSGMYWWWKMGRDENWGEIELFDAYFLSVVTFYLVGRVGYVVSHYGEIGGMLGALSLLSSPGINYPVGIVAGVLVASWFVRVKGWEIWKAWDSMVVALSLVMVFGSMGILLNRGELPMDMVGLVWALVSFGVVSMVRKNFRFYTWYKGESSVARDGLATLVGIGMLGVYYLVFAIVNGYWWMLGGVVIMMIGVVGIILARSGSAKVGIVQWMRDVSKRDRKKRRK